MHVGHRPKWARSAIMDNKAVEEEIIKEHGQAISFVGQRIYQIFLRVHQIFLPVLEITSALNRILQLNKDMYKLKEAEKAAKPKEPTPV